MVLQLSRSEGVVQKSIPVDDNFQLGPPDYFKFTPALVSQFKTNNKLWAVNKRLDLTVNQLGHLNLPQKLQDTGAVYTTKRLYPESRPSTEDEKFEMFSRSLTVILSCVYAVFIVTLGTVIYISDLVTRKAPLAEAFSIYLVIIGLLYFVFLYSDIRRYLNYMKAREVDAISKDDFSLRNDAERSQPLSIVWNSLGSVTDVNDNAPHHYCFAKGRHSGSFYLKIGAAGFCLGHMIHNGLLLAYQVAFLLSDADGFYQCASVTTLVLNLIYPIYSFFQLFFIFKYSNVIVNCHQGLARFALMHCIGASLCFWVWTILRETVDSLQHPDHDTIISSLSTAHMTVKPMSHTAATTYHLNGDAEGLLSLINASSLANHSCRGPTQLSIVFESFSPYLYPFTIEYSILVVGVLYIIWQNIGNCEEKISNGCRPPPMTQQSGFASNIVIHADCHSSNKGLFAGFIVLTGSFLSIILFFVAMADRKYIDVGLKVNTATELSLLVLMTAAVALAYRQITRLDVNHRPISLLDDLLLFLCIPAFFLQAILSITPAIKGYNYLAMTTVILQVVQVLLQTPFIIDGLRRCSNSCSLRIKKPGRELVTFLIVCNVAMWITETFEIKSQSTSRDHRSQFYGRVLWTMLSHMTLPLTMFYRFHSSVCLVDIWKSAYEKGH